MLLFLLIYLVSMLILFLNQEKIIFQSVKLNSNHKFSIAQNFKEINLQTTDNNIINAIHLKVNKPKGIVLYFHGNKGNLDRWVEIASYFTNLNHDVFVIDYRSYGKSTGNFNENLMYKDAQVCYNYVKKQYSEDKITIYGRSLGCTFALKVASSNQPRQIVLEAPFYNLTSVAKYHYPLMPYKLLMKYKFESNTFIKNVNCKTTIFHGTNDKVIPYESGKKLFSNSNKNTTNFITLKKGTHHNLMRFDLYKNTIKELLE